MRLRSVRGALLLAFAVVLAPACAGAQDSLPRKDCRAPHPAPKCDGYFVFEANGAVRLGGTTVNMMNASKPALPTWLGVSFGKMNNLSPSTSVGGALAVGGSGGEGPRLALLFKRRSWREDGGVVDISTGPLMATLMTTPGGTSGATTFGWTGDIGVGKPGFGLLTIGADAAHQMNSAQFAIHGGARAEARGLTVVAVALAIAVVVGLNDLANSGGEARPFQHQTPRIPPTIFRRK